MAPISLSFSAADKKSLETPSDFILLESITPISFFGCKYKTALYVTVQEVRPEVETIEPLEPAIRSRVGIAYVRHSL